MQKKFRNFEDVKFYVRHAAFGVFSQNELIIHRRIIYDYEVIYVVEGVVVVEMEDTVIELKPNDIHIMPPNVWHNRKSKNNMPCKYYNFHFEFLDKNDNNPLIFDVKKIYMYALPVNGIIPINEQLINRDIIFLQDYNLPISITIKNTQEVLSLCAKIVHEFCTNNIYSTLKINNYFSLLFIEILSANTGIENKCNIDKVIDAFILEINNCFQPNIDIKEFVEKYYFSYEYFRKCFKKRLGIAPQKYVQQKRFDVAINYLRTGLFTVDKVAEMVGFESTSYFSAQFKQIVGYSPSSYILK